MKTDFKDGDEVQARAYFPTNLYNMSLEYGKEKCVNNNNYYDILFFVNDETEPRLLKYQGSGGSKWTTVRFGLTAMNAFQNLVNYMESGTHKITVKMVNGRYEFSNPECNKVIAEGSFTYTRGGSKYVTTNNGRIKAAKMNNPKLLAEMKAVYNAKYGSSGEKAVGGRITSSAWKIVRNAFGVIIRREIYGQMQVKKANGDCWVYELRYDQKYNGGTYGPTSWGAVVAGENNKIDCSKFK